MGISDRDYMKNGPVRARRNIPLTAVIAIALLLLAGIFWSRPHGSADAGAGTDPAASPLTLEKSIPQELGTFVSDSGFIAIADPGCSLKEVQEGSIARKVKALKGEWRAVALLKVFSGEHPRINGELAAYHQSVPASLDLVWTRENSHIAVDSGQAGFFDWKRFKDVSVISTNIQWTFNGKPADPFDLWYSYCCEQTAKKETGSIIPFGVVVNSGYGDGTYVLYSCRDDAGNVVALKLVFVNDQGQG